MIKKNKIIQRITGIQGRLDLALLFFISLFLFLAHDAAAQDKISIGEKRIMHSKVLNEDRTILVGLPAGYSYEQKSYPVFYMLDGEYHFEHVYGILSFLSGIGRIPEFILVAVSNVDRNRDFTPSHVDYLPVSGGGESFLRFFELELLPGIDSLYRTNSFRLLAGHSLGGEFTVFTLLEKPELFRAYIAISPVLHYDNSILINRAKKDLKYRYRTPKFFFMTVGDERDYFEPLSRFTVLVRERCSQSIEFNYKILDKEQHGTIAHRGIYLGLETIFADWQMPELRLQKGIGEIEAYSRELSEKYAYPVDNIERDINRLGYIYFIAGDYQRAVSVFSENIRRFPRSVNAWDSLAEAWAKSGDRKKAAECYSEALRLARELGYPSLDYLVRKVKEMSE